jgi:hypothetical protein
MKFICDVCNWDYGRTLGYPVGGITPGLSSEIPSEITEHTLYAAAKEVTTQTNA